MRLHISFSCHKTSEFVLCSMDMFFFFLSNMILVSIYWRSFVLTTLFLDDPFRTQSQCRTPKFLVKSQILVNPEVDASLLQ